MATNRETLGWLFETGRIDLRRGEIFDIAPVAVPADFDFGRVEGMMLGLAIGDSLGNTTEAQLPAERAAAHGEIRDYLPNHYAGDRPVGVPSDDSQLAFWTLEQMIADQGLIPENVAGRFTRQQIFGVGSAVREFLATMKSGTPWYEAGSRSAGNGALMRISPVVIPHLRTGTTDLWADTALLAMITHNNSGSVAACLAFVNMLWQLLHMAEPPDPAWWVAMYVDAARDLEIETYEPRGGEFTAFSGPIWRFVAERVPAAFDAGKPTVDACNAWYSGAFLLETVPSTLYILMRYAGDPEEAIVRAVNDTKDSDTVGAIVGAAVGALHGKDALPERWRSAHLGRTADSDDGRMHELLAEARRLWWS